VTATSPLFVVADTSVMWVSAEIHERDWPALKTLEDPGASIDVQVPALGEDWLQAGVRFVGGSVDPTTRSVPLIAQIDNAAGRLKPGMFVWAEVPMDVPHQGLVAPITAVMRHEQQPFVFVSLGKDSFRRVDVQLGLENRSNVEILAGLQAGDRVVDRGAFYLKSELLLEREK
jgi:Membrane-fusion protein